MNHAGCAWAGAADEPPETHELPGSSRFGRRGKTTVGTLDQSGLTAQQWHAWMLVQEKYEPHKSFGRLHTFFLLHPRFNLPPEMLAACHQTVWFQSTLAQFTTMLHERHSISRIIASSSVDCPDFLL